MTFLEAKEILKEIRKAKNRARNIKARISEYEEDMALLQPLTCFYGVSGGGRGSLSKSKVELAFERLEADRQRFTEALLLAFELEDKLSSAIDSLPELERDIIIGCYISGKEHWKLANELGYSERMIRYLKNKAIHKICETL